MPEIHAVIGVWHRGDDTYYVKRSTKMLNYPGVWSLLSIRYNPETFLDKNDIERAASYFRTMSQQRLSGAAIKVNRFLIDGSSEDNPMGVQVHLRLYEIEIANPIYLNPDFYTDSGWMNFQEYEKASQGEKCGLCLRLWGDYAWLSGITDQPFRGGVGEH